jgi:hypothetical protein
LEGKKVRVRGSGRRCGNGAWNAGDVRVSDRSVVVQEGARVRGAGTVRFLVEEIGGWLENAKAEEKEAEQRREERRQRPVAPLKSGSESGRGAENADRIHLGFDSFCRVF